MSFLRVRGWFIAGCIIHLIQSAPGIAATQIIYVNQASSALTENGASWNTPYRRLQDALAAASPSMFNTVEIWVARGTYTPTEGTNRFATFELKSHLRILGGFRGFETVDTQRSPLDVTVLSGDIGLPVASPVTPQNAIYSPPAPDFLRDPGYRDNCYNVLRGSNLTDVVLDHLVIAHGYAQTPGLTESNYLAMSREAQVSTNLPAGYQSNPEFPHDHRVLGGGLYFEGAGAPDTDEARASLMLNACYFHNNYSYGYGGAVTMIDGKALVGESTFNNNRAAMNGGAWWGYNQVADMNIVEFNRNFAGEGGGAIALVTPMSKRTLPSAVPEGVSLEKMAVNSANTLLKVLVKRPLTNARKELIAAIGESGGSLSKNYSRVLAGYFYVQIGVQVGDVAYQIAQALGADTDNEAARIWVEFSTGFKKYATVDGWTEMLAEVIIEEVYGDTPGPSIEKQAWSILYSQEYLYNVAPESIITYGTFTGNEAQGDGGAIAADRDNLHLESCIFRGNTANNGGALDLSGYTTPFVFSSVFDGNSSYDGHSAVANSFQARTFLVNCSLVNNNAEGGNGYALGNELGSHVRVFNSIFWNNRNARPEFASGGADVFTMTREILFTNPMMKDQYEQAGAAYVDLIATCDIRESILQGLGSLPAGTDNIPIVPPTVSMPTQAMIDEWIEQHALAEQTGIPEPYRVYNLGEGNRPGIFTTYGNTSADPLLDTFLVPSPGSPALDSGNANRLNSGIYGSLTGVDVYRENRISGASIDRGAAEFQYDTNITRIVLVDADATGDNSGTNWANAMTDLKSAVAITNAEIWVAAGTYRPSTTGNRTETFNLAPGVRIYGGFNGTETRRSSRNINANPVILSGNIGDPMSASDNSYQVMRIFNAGGHVVLDGLTIRDGNGQSGAGVSIYGSSPLFSDVTFVSNNSGASGGAINISDHASAPVFEECTFTGNTATDGGALYVHDGTATVRNTSFALNLARRGGAIHAVNDADVDLVNVLLHGNTASGSPDSRGGAIYGSNSRLTIRHTTLAANHAAGSSTAAIGGGGILVSGNRTLSIRNSILWSNTVANSGSGGVLSPERRQIEWINGATVSSSGLLVEGQTDLAGTGNQSSPPYFVNESEGDFRLRAESPAVDAGPIINDGSVPPRDLDRNPRVANIRADLGAYEFQGTPRPLATSLSIDFFCTNSRNYQLRLTQSGTQLIGPFWQVDRDNGSGFVTLANDAVHSGTSSTILNVNAPTLAMDGWAYRLMDQYGFVSQIATIRVSNAILYVTPTGSGAQDGSSWAHAFGSLAQALQHAAPCTEIWVAKGTYTVGGTDPAAAFRLPPGVAVYGGFIGTETLLNQRNPWIHVTVLNGDLGGSFRSRYVIVNEALDHRSPIDQRTILDGFTVLGASEALILNDGCSPVIRDCVLVHGGTAAGNGIINRGASVPVLEDNLIVRAPGPACGSGGTVQFTVDGSAYASQIYPWQVNTGSGFQTPYSNATYQTVATVTESSSGSELAIVALPSLYEFHQFRFQASSLAYTSPALRIPAGVPSVVYVKSNASGANNGSSWSNAYTSLHTALTMAPECAQIWVAAGTYQAPTSALSFELRSGVAVYGGFAGSETSLLQRNWTSNVTRLIARNGEPVFRHRGERVPVDASALLDGFTLTGSTNFALMVNLGASPTVRNCRFADATVRGIYQSDASLLVENCTFSNLTDGALDARKSTVRIVASRFERNRGSIFGGAITLDAGCALTVDRSTFSQNQGAWAGSLLVNIGNTATVTRCRFEGNESGGGGAILGWGGSVITVRDTLIAGNTSLFIGGGIAFYGASLSLSGVTIADNRSAYAGAGLELRGGTATVVNSILWGNRSTGPNETLEQRQARVHGGSTLNASYSIVEGRSTITGTGVTGYNPLFEHTDTAKYVPGEHSPAKDAGSNGAVTGPLDLAGMTRILGSAVDLGAFEVPIVQATTPLLLFELPVSQSLCELTPYTFAISGPQITTTNLIWMMYNGTNWQTLANGADYTIVTTNGGSTLTLNQPALALNGRLFEALLTGLAGIDFTVNVVPPRFLYVNASNTTPGAGTAWSNAFTTIDAALAQADACTEIWVARGVYRPAAGASNTWTLAGGGRLLGGFAGGETNRLQRELAANPTIMRPRSGRAVFTLSGFDAAVPRTVVVDGFTIDGEGTALRAIDALNARPTLRNLTISNFAGRAIAMDMSSAPRFEHSTFAGNAGGVARIIRSNPEFIFCTFRDNGTNEYAGAFDILSSSPRFEDSTFTGNRAAQLGGAMQVNGGTTTVSRCVFTGNQAGYYGGAINVRGDTVVVDNALFVENRAGFAGGAVNVESSGGRLTVYNSTLVKNAITSLGQAGGAFNSGGNLTVYNSILWGNTDPYSATVEQQQVDGLGGVLSVQRSYVQDLATLGGGNVGGDPVFVDPDAANYRLHPQSPLVNRGTNVAGVGSLDLVRNPRIVQSTNDLGAYETTNLTASTVINVTRFPVSVSVCEGTDAVFLFDAGSMGVSSFIWQRATSGTNFADFLGDAQHVFTTNGTQRILTIPAAALSLNGERFRLRHTGSSFTSAPFTLTVLAPSILHVDVHAAGANNGSSWSDAYTNLSQAIAVASPCTEIWVADGTYVPSPAYDGNNSFTLKPDVRIFGGFAGGESLRSERNWSNQVATLSGRAGHDTIVNMGSLANIDRSAWLDGFTILSQPGRIGLANLMSSPTLRNLRFTGNDSIALLIQQGAPLVEQCTFESNRYYTAYTTGSGDPVFRRCTFRSNIASDVIVGGFVIQSANGTVEDSLFEGNEAASGALYVSGTGSVRFVRSIFRHNHARLTGGVGDLGAANTLFVNCLLVDNTSAFDAGAAVVRGGETKFLNCTIANNQAGRNAGALLHYGGVLRLHNTILGGNADSTGESYTANLYGTGGLQDIQRSILPGYSGGNTNIAKPYVALFVDPSAGNYQQTTYSPSVNAGSTSLVAGVTNDLALAPRVFNNQHVDIGAYELQGFPVATDSKLTRNPQSLETCVEDTAVFSVQAETAAVDPWGFYWEYSTNGSWTFFANAGGNALSGPSFGSYQTYYTNGLGQLIVSGITNTMDGWKFRARIVGEPHTSSPALLTVLPQEVIHVNGTAAPGGNGRSWSTAYRSFAEAISSVSDCRRVIWMARGVYDGNLTIPPRTRVYGGFAGSETSIAQRIIAANPTVIRSTNGYGVLFSNSPEITGRDTLLDGVTVERPGGSAVFVFSAEPTLRNVTARGSETGFRILNSTALVERCVAESNTYRGVSVSGGRPLFSNLIARANAGTGIGIDGTSAAQTSRYANALIHGNADGGVQINGDVRVSFEHATIAHNRNNLTYGAGLYAEGGGRIELHGSIVWGNRTATNTPTAMLVQQIDANLFQSTVVTARYATIEGLTNGIFVSSDGNDPLFQYAPPASTAPTSAGDFRVQPCSPAIGKAWWPLTPEVIYDLDGNNRTNNGFATDRGAYEFTGSTSTPIVITRQPSNLVFCATNAVNAFRINATGSSLSYRWEIDRGDGAGYLPVTDNGIISGATTTQILFTVSDPDLDGSYFRCRITSTAGCETVSLRAMLTMLPSRLYVDASATGANDGSSWSNAFTSFQAAMTSAYLDVCGSEVWVADGTYTITTTIDLPNHLSIYGGFAGGETGLHQRNPALHRSLLTAPGIQMLQAQGYRLIQTMTNNYVIETPRDQIILDGLVFSNANTAIWIVDEARPLIRNCSFEQNTYGISTEYAPLQVWNTRFIGNATAVYNTRTPRNGIDFGMPQHDFNYCVFQANDLGIGGSGQHRYELRNCLLTGNGTSGISHQLSDMEFIHCTIAGNGGYGASGRTLTLRNSILWGNAQGDGYAFLSSSVNGQNSLIGTNTNPLFVAPQPSSAAPTTAGDYRLQPCSPAINGGSDTYLPWSITWYNNSINAYVTENFALTNDLAGTARALDGAPDMGAYETPGIQLRITAQPVGATGSHGTPATFTVGANVPATYQWQADAPGGAITYVNLVNGRPFSGATTPTLTVSQATADYSGYQFRAVVTDSNGCVRISNPAGYTHLSVLAASVQPAGSSTNAPASAPVSMTLDRGINTLSVTPESLAVFAGYRGLLKPALGDIVSVTASGSTVTLLPARPFAAGEKIDVTARSTITTTNGFGMQPFSWSFHAAVGRGGTGRFATSSLADAHDIAFADLARNGLLDALLATTSSLAAATHPAGPTEATYTGILAQSMRTVTASDLNGDGYPDLVALDGTGTARTWFSTAGGSLDPGQILTGSWRTAASSDLDRDGDLDLVLAGDAPAQAWLNNGLGTLSDSGQRFGSTGCVEVAAADMNRDGAPDVVFGLSGQPSAFSVWRNTGFAEFTLLSSSNDAGNVLRLHVEDFTGDNIPDVLMALAGKPAQIWSNNGQGSFINHRILSDVTQPGDTAVTIFGAINPGHEFIPFDNSTASYLWTFNAYWMFQVTPASGPSLVQGFSITASADPTRRPTSIYVYGKKNFADINPWQLLGEFNPDFTAPYQKRYLFFPNSTVYTNYRVELSASVAPSIELTEIELLKADPLFGSNTFVDVEVADLDADGQRDVLGVRADGVVERWHATGGGFYSKNVASPATGVAALWAADLDGDADIDLLARNQTGGLRVLAHADVTGPEDAPFAFDPGYFTTVLAGVDRPALEEIQVTSLPVHGALRLNGAPVLAGLAIPAGLLADMTYHGATNFTGHDRFTWVGSTASGTVGRTFTARIVVTNTPDSALAVDDTLAVVQGTATNRLADQRLNLLGNDENMDGLPLTTSLLAAPTNGSATVNPDGTFVYTHDDSETRGDSFTYLVDNGFAQTSTGTVWITVVNRPDPPSDLLLDQAYVYDTDPVGSVVGRLTAVDQDWDDTHTFSLVTGAGDAGNASFTLSSNVLVTAAAFDYTTQTSYSVRVRTTDSAALAKDQVFTIAVRTVPVVSNRFYRFDDYLLHPTPIFATDEDGDALAYLVVTQAQRGMLFDNPTNTAWTYFPTIRPGYDYFAYAATDGTRTSSVGVVEILVNLAPFIATNNAYQVEAGVPYPFTPYLYDPDGDPLTYAITLPPVHGTITNIGPDFTYTANAGYGGTDQFTFTITDPYGSAATGTVVFSVENYHRVITSASGSGSGTLAAAIGEMNGNPYKPWFIEFAPGLANQTITLTGVSDQVQGPTAIPIHDRIRFHGTAATGLVIQIDAAVTMRFFRVAGNARLDLRDVELRGGRQVGDDAPPDLSGGLALGGTILNYGTSLLQRVVIRASSVLGGAGSAGTTNSGGFGSYGGEALGAGIANLGGRVEIDTSAFIQCTATGGPGGPGDTPAQNGQTGRSRGGALYNQEGYVLLYGSTVDGCAATEGSACALTAYTRDSVIDLEQNSFVNLIGGPALALEDSPVFDFNSYAYPPVSVTGIVANGSCTFTLFRPHSQWRVTGVTTGTHGTASFTTGTVTYAAGPTMIAEDRLVITITGPRGSVTNVPATIYAKAGPTANDDATVILPGQTATIPVLLNDLTGPNPPVTIDQWYGFTNGFAYPVGSNLVYEPFNFVQGVNDTVTYVIRDANNLTATARVSVVIRSTTLVVTTNAPSGPGSIVEALLTSTNPLPAGTWTIEFASNLVGQTFLLTQPLDPAEGGSGLRLTSPLTLSGEKAPGLVIARATNAPPMRLLSIAPGVAVTLRDLTFANGYVDATNGSARGGAILNRGLLDLRHVTFLGNRAVGNGVDEALGGAIYNEGGNLQVDSSRFLQNQAGNGRGGAVFNRNGDVLLQSTLVQSNVAATGGGLFTVADGAAVQVGIFGVRLENPGSARDFEAVAENGGSVLHQVFLSDFLSGPSVMLSATLGSYTADGGDLALAVSAPLGLPGGQQVMGMSIDPTIIDDADISISGTGSVRTLSYLTKPGVAGRGIIAAIVMEDGYTYMNGIAIPITPAARDDVMDRTGTGVLAIAAADLLDNDLGAAGDPPSVVGVVTPTRNGGSVALSGGTITYTPPAGPVEPDEFDYAIADGSLRSSTGRVLIVPDTGTNTPAREVRLRVIAPAETSVVFAGTNRISRVRLMRLDFQGLPLRSYRIEAAETPRGPWFAIGFATADDDGRIYLQEELADGMRYRHYRTVEISP